MLLSQTILTQLRDSQLTATAQVVQLQSNWLTTLVAVCRKFQQQFSDFGLNCSPFKRNWVFHDVEHRCRQVPDARSADSNSNCVQVGRNRLLRTTILTVYDWHCRAGDLWLVQNAFKYLWMQGQLVVCCDSEFRDDLADCCNILVSASIAITTEHAVCWLYKHLSIWKQK